MDLQLLSQCGSMYNFLSTSVPEIHSHVAGTLSSQPTNIYTAAVMLSPVQRSVSDHCNVAFCWRCSHVQGSHFPAVSRISAKMKFQNPRKKKLIREKKIRPKVFLKRQLKLTQTASKLHVQRRADDRILHLVFALRHEISRDQLVAIVFGVKLPPSDFVRRHEAAFRDFHIFLVGALHVTASTCIVTAS